jgi:hypothetical protein
LKLETLTVETTACSIAASTGIRTQSGALDMTENNLRLAMPP